MTDYRKTHPVFYAWEKGFRRPWHDKFPDGPKLQGQISLLCASALQQEYRDEPRTRTSALDRAYARLLVSYPRAIVGHGNPVGVLEGAPFHQLEVETIVDEETGQLLDVYRVVQRGRMLRWPEQRLGKTYIPKPDDPTVYQLVRRLLEDASPSGGEAAVQEALLDVIPHAAHVLVPIVSEKGFLLCYAPGSGTLSFPGTFPGKQFLEDMAASVLRGIFLGSAVDGEPGEAWDVVVPKEPRVTFVCPSGVSGDLDAVADLLTSMSFKWVTAEDLLDAAAGNGPFKLEQRTGEVILNLSEQGLKQVFSNTATAQ